MKKVLFAMTVLCGLSLGAFAQSSSSQDSKFSIGFEGGLPTGDAKQAYNAVLGASLKYDYNVATGTYLTGSAGYNAFLVKSQYKSIVGSTDGAIPVKAGIKYFFGSGFYGEGQLGAAFSTESGGGTAFVYSPGIGYDFGSGVDVGVRYEAWSKDGTIGQVGLRLGFSF
ncbi:hypothetical protein [Mucilaginibacter psychrotolerans]|uniref:Outer membrane protein beta-barrel domain-containing protein n=1 Tax=Mucilaginibacter psychrotolerans TaxID=1524096 RepID=A0A4Y8S7L9_9SPHI|nr:hypothetical protein [Mucilaginibacter psychrotolerans]TFF34938.1 hypothetical protein E2R66_20425 [Mucilaginibacter psychrotolerans]